MAERSPWRRRVWRQAPRCRNDDAGVATRTAAGVRSTEALRCDGRRTRRGAMTAASRRPVRVQLVQAPESDRHEGAITEPIKGQPLPEPPERERLPPEPASSCPPEESERHKG